MQLDKLRKFIEEQQYKSEPTPQLLQAVGEHMMGVPSRSPEVVRLFLLAHLSTELVRAEVAACHEEMLGLLSQLIEHGQWRGEVRKDHSVQKLRTPFDNSCLENWRFGRCARTLPSETTSPVRSRFCGAEWNRVTPRTEACGKKPNLSHQRPPQGDALPAEEAEAFSWLSWFSYLSCV
jgi:hypothetical protein